MGQVNKIGIRVQNIYKIEVEDCVALSSKAEKMLSRDVDELWHKRLGHLHHGTLKILQQMSTGLPKGTLEQVNTCKGVLWEKTLSIPFTAGIVEQRLL